MFNVLVVDDELSGRQRIIDFSDNHPELSLTIRWECANIREAAAVIGQYRSDISLIIMDSEMDGNRRQGVDFLLTQRLMNVQLPPTILLSSHPDLGDSADEAEVRYMTKPFSEGRLVAVIRKLLRLENDESIEFHYEKDGLMGPQHVLLRDIVLIRATNTVGYDAVKILTVHQQEFLVKASRNNTAPVHTLSFYTESYKAAGLVRVNRSEVVNVARVTFVSYNTVSLILEGYARSIDINEQYRDAFLAERKKRN
ncbi:response regulator [Spirosoma sp. KCTC 42546]|uniref:LytR/AlgR family response regulator transcription factor n=1 Tax=Spirosoma sp. KCTC 42546 TaxID=2520506 RepID=UPI0011582A6B|nr:response regulator [Spirosoma sp. KCTC 42546]QDK79968.1 response regulator [Spirosoma sp. KCTC 42546]